jgi:phosphotriesterase-related protein
MRTIRILIPAILFLAFYTCHTPHEGSIMTVNGKIAPTEMGLTLHHEHVLVDFIGADSVEPPHYNRQEALKIILPQIRKLTSYGVKTFVEVTPRYLGRDVGLLRQLSDSTGLHFITNTGYYGAMENKFIPSNVMNMSAPEIAGLWIDEARNGIDGTDIFPGFIKIGVERKPLSDFHRTLARAAALTHKATGLTIMSHTGPSTGAFQQLEILKEEGVAPDAFIWTHAHNEKDSMKHVQAALMGTWVAFDAFRGGEQQTAEFVHFILNMKQHNCLHRLLLSHDAGWFDPAQPDGHNYAPHTALFDQLFPALKEAGITPDELNLILVKNPAEALTIRKRLLKN